METERNLLFGVTAFQSGALDADRLAETCASWVGAPTLPMGDVLVERGLITAEQRTEFEKVVAAEIETHGGDARSALAATLDGRTLEAIGDVPAGNSSLGYFLSTLPPSGPAQGSLTVLGSLPQGDRDGRDRYTLTQLHAKGGMGRVWLARDGQLGREIALKDLRPEQTGASTVCSRFLYEARITAQLEHPGIVPVYELGQGDAPYYTMRFVRGHTLGEAIRAYHKKRAAGEAGPIDLAELLNAFVAVCHAVAYAHSRGIIHRDLKGQNVVLGEFGEVIVLDWGLAKRVEANEGADENLVSDGPNHRSTAVVAARGETSASAAHEVPTLPPNAPADSAVTIDFSTGHPTELGPGNLGPNLGSNPSPNGPANRESGAGPDGTLDGQLLGTPAYMAPEQASGDHKRIGRRSDIYGLGAILYETLTGTPPFVGPKTSEIIRQVCQEEPVSPRKVVADVAPALEAICSKAMSKDPARRYATATELAHEVRCWLIDEPVDAYPEPWTRRMLRWTRRHKTMVSTAAGLFVTTTIALAVSTVLISSERNEAEAQGQQARQAVHLLTEIADIGFDEQLDPLQKKFLEKALAYYENFTSRASGDPAVRLEHGRSYQQMGDIERKLGRLADSERSYRRAIELIEPLAATAPAATGREISQSLARTRTLLGDLLVRRGADAGQADTLYSQALDAQLRLADVKKDAGATPLDRLRLGQTLKSQADLLRLNGRFSRALGIFDQATAQLEPALAVDVQSPEVRIELALAVDARGWVHRELGEMTAAERDFHQALELLDKLVAEFPTVPRYREVLAKACNSLGVLEQDAGRLDDAELHHSRQIPLARRLAGDFPDRPDYRSILGRALTNLGTVLIRQGRVAEAEPILREAIALNSAIAAKSPDDTQAQFYLAISHHDLGEVLMKQGNAQSAIGSFQNARAINEAMAKRLPDKPRYRSDLASNLDSLARAMGAIGQAGVDDTFRAANTLYEQLIATSPDNVDYRIRQAVCLRDQGNVIADAGRNDQAEPIYQKALALLDTTNSKLRTAEWQRRKAEILTNLGALHRPGAEDAFRRSITISQELLAQRPGSTGDRHALAIAQNNLADLLVERKRLPEAGPFFVDACKNFDKLVADSPKAPQFQSHFATVLAALGKWQDKNGKSDDAKASLSLAVAHQREAVRLGKNAPAFRVELAAHLIDLSDVNRKLGAFDEAGSLALDATKIAPLAVRPNACYDAAQVLARLLVQVAGDQKLATDERDRLNRKYLARTVVLLREAIDSAPALATLMKADPDLKALGSRPQFQAIMSSLVDVGGK